MLTLYHIQCKVNQLETGIPPAAKAGVSCQKKDEGGLVDYYTFNDGTAKDLTGNNHGTPQGFVAKTVSPNLSLDGVNDVALMMM